MDIKEYQRYVRAGASSDYTKELAIVGLVGELGELADVIKKSVIYRDQSKFIEKYHARVEDKIVEEAGDVLWQFVNLLNMCDIDIDWVIEYNIVKLNQRHGGAGKTAIDGGER